MNCSIEKNSSVPVYVQIKKRISDYLDAKTIKPGDRLPTDEEFCSMFGVSRMTARRAVSELVDEGQVVRVRGKGTFVGQESSPKKPVKTKLIGVIMPELSVSLDSRHSPSHYHALRAIEQFFGKKKFNLNIFTSNYGPLAPELVGQVPVSGAVMLFPEPRDQTLLEAFVKSGLPFVAINSFLEGTFNRVNTDAFGAGSMAVEHLIGQGRRKIAFVAYETFRGGGASHYHGYESAMLRNGLTPMLRTVDRDVVGSDFCRAYPAILDGLDGVVAAGDPIAADLLVLAAEKGIKVPRDIAVTGYFNLAVCEKTNPRLTSFTCPEYSELGLRAAERLYELMNKPGLQSKTINLETKMIQRESSVG